MGNAEFTLGRLLRLSLFQLSVGMVQTLFVGTLNRVMILELSVPASLVAVMLAIPLLVAPFRALVGFKSDTYRSVLGCKRVPFLWIGTLMQFAGLAIMPFALLVLSSDRAGQAGTIGSGTSARGSVSCWLAPVRTPRRQPVWPWPPMWWTRTSGRGWWR